MRIPSIWTIPDVGRKAPGVAAPVLDLAPFAEAGGNNNGSTTTAVATVPAQGMPAGSTVIIMGGANGITLTGVTDSKGNTYTNRNTGGVVSTMRTFLADSVLTTPLVAGDTITVTCASANSIAFRVACYPSLLGFDAQAQLGFDGSSNGAGGSITPAAAGELILGIFGTVNRMILTPGPGFTDHQGQVSTTSFVRAVDWESKIYPSTAAIAATAVINGTPSAQASAITAAYKH